MLLLLLLAQVLDKTLSISPVSATAAASTQDRQSGHTQSYCLAKRGAGLGCGPADTPWTGVSAAAFMIQRVFWQKVAQRKRRGRT